MHCLFLALLLACPIQESYDTYGKTEAEILAMGENKWSEFYASKAGDSTLAMVDGNSIFGVALTHRNDKILATISNAGLKTTVAKLRKLLTDYATTSIDLGSNESGGGTMWNPVYAHVATEVEGVVFGLLSGKDAPKRSHIVVSKVNSEIHAAAQAVEKEHADKDSASYFKYGEAKQSLASLRANFSRIVAIASTLKREDSDRVLYFCFDFAQMAEKPY